MSKKISSILFIIATMIAGTIVTSCSNVGMEDDVMQQSDTQTSTRAVGSKTPKLTVYIETNDVNPLNAKEYLFSNTSEEVVDHVILFASNIRGTKGTVQLYHNNNQSHILSNASTLIAPLQQKGIKVLLGLLGDHTGVGFANLTPAMISSFAQQVADCVNTYGLDGVDLDDEYAEYGKISGLPSPSSTIMGSLITKLRELMPNKLITTFYYGYAGSATGSLDYMWPNFGCNENPPSGLPTSKWAKLTISITNQGYTTPGSGTIQECSNSYSGYGAVMMFNMREWDTSYIMNDFASNVWGSGKTVEWTGVSHPKNY